MYSGFCHVQNLLQFSNVDASIINARSFLKLECKLRGYLKPIEVSKFLYHSKLHKK